MLREATRLVESQKRAPFATALAAHRYIALEAAAERGPLSVTGALRDLGSGGSFCGANILRVDFIALH